MTLKWHDLRILSLTLSGLVAWLLWLFQINLIPLSVVTLIIFLFQSLYYLLRLDQVGGISWSKDSLCRKAERHGMHVWAKVEGTALKPPAFKYGFCVLVSKFRTRKLIFLCLSFLFWKLVINNNLRLLQRLNSYWLLHITLPQIQPLKTIPNSYYLTSGIQECCY